jgi:hypothetical protein
MDFLMGDISGDVRVPWTREGVPRLALLALDIALAPSEPAARLYFRSVEDPASAGAHAAVFLTCPLIPSPKKAAAVAVRAFYHEISLFCVWSA